MTQNRPAHQHPAEPRPPRHAILLLHDDDASAWEHAGKKPCGWAMTNGVLEVTPRHGDLVTRDKYGDFMLHVEFCVPSMPDKKGQARGNSGVKLHGIYEIQILDSIDNPTYPAGGCGAIYRFKEPDKNVARPPGEWQTYDIRFRAPRLDAEGKIVEKPRITLVWNGVKVHNEVEVPGPTNSRPMDTLPATGPILLQDHGCPVRFRNIWIVPENKSTTDNTDRHRFLTEPY